MNVCMRRLGAAAMASPAFLTSEGFARASEQTVELRITLEIAQMDSKSPGEAAAKPASITSTPRNSSCLAIRSLSCGLILAPGLCSPSRRVVSKIKSLSLAVVIVVSGHKNC